MKKSTEILNLLIVLGIVVFLGLNLDRYFLRIDLTRNHAFSISEVSRNLRTEIPERVHITYYCSERLKALYSFPVQIEDLLREYAAYSGGKIQVSVVDPAAKREEQRIQALGVYPQQVEVIERNETRVAEVYTGIVIRYLDRHETIPVAVRLETLEYELTSRVRRAVSGDEQVLGLLVGDRALRLEQHFVSLVATLREEFSLRPVSAGETIPGDVDLLIVLGGQDLDEYEVMILDQFLMRGGRAMFAVEGMKIDFQRELAATQVPDSPLLEMLESYGVRVARGFVLDSQCQNFRLAQQLLGQTVWEVLGKYPYWISVSQRFASRDNPITARLAGLDLYWASPLELVGAGEEKGQILATTSSQGWVQTEGPYPTLPERAEMLLRQGHSDQGRYPVAAVLSGRLQSYFRGRSVPVREGEPALLENLLEGSPETRIAVIGDADFVTELFRYTEAEYNLQFASNVVNWLASSDDLLSIKTRAVRDLRLNRIQDARAKARVSLVTEIVAVAVLPLIVIVFGVIRLLSRRRKAAAATKGGRS